MKHRGENVSNHEVVRKIMRTLPLRFDYIVVAIEEAKDLNSIKIEELQCSL